MTRTKQIVLSAAAILAALGAAQATSTPAAAKDKHVKASASTSPIFTRPISTRPA